MHPGTARERTNPRLYVVLAASKSYSIVGPIQPIQGGRYALIAKKRSLLGSAFPHQRNKEAIKNRSAAADSRLLKMPAWAMIKTGFLRRWSSAKRIDSNSSSAVRHNFALNHDVFSGSREHRVIKASGLGPPFFGKRVIPAGRDHQYCAVCRLQSEALTASC